MAKRFRFEYNPRLLDAAVNRALENHRQGWFQKKNVFSWVSIIGAFLNGITLVEQIHLQQNKDENTTDDTSVLSKREERNRLSGQPLEELIAEAVQKAKDAIRDVPMAYHHELVEFLQSCRPPIRDALPVSLPEHADDTPDAKKVFLQQQALDLAKQHTDQQALFLKTFTENMTENQMGWLRYSFLHHGRRSKYQADSLKILGHILVGVQPTHYP